jgi:S1-C subfamily serine protease
MRGRLSTFAYFTIGVILLSPVLSGCLISASAKEGISSVLKHQESYILSLELEFSKKNQGSLERAFSFLDWGANGYATGFLVANGIALTAYHVVSGDLSDNKRRLLGFKAQDQLNVRVYVNGCEATVIEVDKDADLALLSVCGSPKQVEAPKFQSSPSKDEQLLAIARLHGDKQVNRGTLYGSYSFRGQEYWSAKFDMRDGYSGSPVYNERAEVIGVFSGYDWNQRLAVISPGVRAEKLLEDYLARRKQ